MICVECGSHMNKSTEPFEEVFHGRTITISGIEYYKCNQCGEIVFDAAEAEKYDKQIIDKHREIEGLLLPSEIKAIREKYGLKQQEFEKILGVSSPSVSRWETGKVIQSKPVDLLMRAYNDSPELMHNRMEQVEVRSSKTYQNVIPFLSEKDHEHNSYLFSKLISNYSYEDSFTLSMKDLIKEG